MKKRPLKCRRKRNLNYKTRISFPRQTNLRRAKEPALLASSLTVSTRKVGVRITYESVVNLFISWHCSIHQHSKGVLPIEKPRCKLIEFAWHLLWTNRNNFAFCWKFGFRRDMRVYDFCFSRNKLKCFPGSRVADAGFGPTVLWMKYWSAVRPVHCRLLWICRHQTTFVSLGTIKKIY